MFAQTDAPDFTVTDLDGNEYNLYTILEEGKVVVLDASATWCPPCWQFHEGKFLEDIYQKYGPDGTDQVVVLFYEGDANTTLAQLEGTGNTQGNWLEGSSYPFVNESPLTLSGSVWWPLGFPTINVVRPDDKKIIADLYDPWVAGLGLAGMEEIIEGAFPSTSNNSDVELNEVSAFPNPFQDEILIEVADATQKVESIKLMDITGSVVRSIDLSSNRNVTINTTDLASGMYFVHVHYANEGIQTIKLTK